MCSLRNYVCLKCSKCVNVLLGPWKELFTSIAKKEDLFSVAIMGSLLICQYFTLSFSLWSLNSTLLNATTELVITFGYMYIFCWVAESYFGRMFVHLTALIISLTGCFVSFLNEMWEPFGVLKYEAFLLRAVLSSMPLQAAAVLSERKFLKKIISLDHYLFLVMWIGLCGSSVICVILEIYKKYSNFRLVISMCVSSTVCYQLLIVLLKYKVFQESSFYYNIHFAVSKVMIRFVTTKLTGIEDSEQKESSTVNIAAVKIIRMIPFVVSLVMFAISIQGVMFLLAFQRLHVIPPTWMPDFRIPTLTTIVSATILPIMYLYVFPTFHRFKLLKTDLQKIGLGFLLLALCLLCCCGVQYVIDVRIKPFPPSNHSQLNIINDFDTEIKVMTAKESATLQPHQLYSITNDFDNQTSRWFLNVYTADSNSQHLELTAMSKLSILCVASKSGLNCKGIFSTSPPFMYMIPPQSSIICLVNTLPSDVVAVFTDPVSNKNFSLSASANQVIDKIAVPKHYNITVFSKEDKLIRTKNVNIPECSATVVYIFSENQNTKIRFLILAHTKVLPIILLFPPLLFFGTSDAIAILYMFRFWYEKSPQALLATMGTFAYTLELGPKMFYSLVGDQEMDSSMIFFIFLAHVSFLVIHVLITIKIELYKELDNALRSSIVLGRYVPTSTPTVHIVLPKESEEEKKDRVIEPIEENEQSETPGNSDIELNSKDAIKHKF